MHDPEKSDSGIVAAKLANKAGRPVTEPAEPRPGTKGNEGQQNTHRAQYRARVTQALDRVRKAARLKKKERFTALLHHITVDTGMCRSFLYGNRELSRSARCSLSSQTRALGSRTRRQALPVGWFKGLGNVRGAAGNPPWLVPRSKDMGRIDAEHIPFASPAQVALNAADTVNGISRDPAERHTGRDGSRDHAGRDLRLGRKANPARHVRGLQTSQIVAPSFR